MLQTSTHDSVNTSRNKTNSTVLRVYNRIYFGSIFAAIYLGVCAVSTCIYASGHCFMVTQSGQTQHASDLISYNDRLTAISYIVYTSYETWTYFLWFRSVCFRITRKSKKNAQECKVGFEKDILKAKVTIFIVV